MRQITVLLLIFLIGCGGVEPSDETIVNVPNNPPTVSLRADPTTGNAPLEIRFTARISDLDRDPLTYFWDFGNGETAGAEVTRAYTYKRAGTYTATLSVSDGETETSSSVTITVTGTGSSEPSNPPNANFNRQQTERLRGTWLFVYAIISTFDDAYSLTSAVEESDITPGEYNIFGTDEFGDLVIAGYSSDLREFSLLDPGVIIDKLFTFNFSDQDTVEGCYFQVDVGTGEFSECYFMAGGRISTAGITRQRLQTPSEDKRLREVEMKNGSSNVSKAAVKRFQNMKQLYLHLEKER